MVRKGQISSVDYKKYLAAVVFAEDDATEQANRAVSADFAFLMALGYDPPNAEDWVTVLCYDDAPEHGIILPRQSSNKFKPEFDGRQGLFRRWFGRSQKKCYVQYADPENGGGNDGKFLFHNDDDLRAEAKNVELEADEKFSGKAREIEVEADTTAKIKAGATLTIEGGGSVEIKGGTVNISPDTAIQISAPSGTVTITAGNISANGVSLPFHTHNCTAPGTPAGPPIPLGV